MQIHVFCIATCLLTQLSPGPSQPLSVAEVLDRWDAGSRLIESYDLTTKLVMDNYIVKENGVDRLKKPGESYPDLEFHAHIFKDGPKRFGKFSPDGDGHFASELLYDGVMLTSAEKPQNQYNLQQGHGPFGSIEYEDYETIYRTVYGTADRVAMSKERQSRLLPREGNLYVVDVPTTTTGNFATSAWRVWLDPTRNFMPRRWSQWLIMAGERVRNLDCELDLAEVVPGVWAAVAARKSVYNKNKQSAVFGKIMGVDTMTVDMSKSRFNVPIAADVFSMKIPNGATVVDRTRNIVYTQGASDPDAYLSNLAAEGKKAVANLPSGGRLSESTLIVPDRPSFWTSGRILAACVIVAIVCSGAIIARRMWGRHA